tara:strand:+ start:167 stop:379 length:213 start_codon:yes stop_codon:yes gene_type:complete
MVVVLLDPTPIWLGQLIALRGIESSSENAGLSSKTIVVGNEPISRNGTFSGNLLAPVVTRNLTLVVPLFD